MRFVENVAAALASVSLIAAPVVAAPSAATQLSIDARASAEGNAESELFRGRRGGALVFILLAAVIAAGERGSS